MSAPPLAAARTEAPKLASETEPIGAGSGNFHPLTRRTTRRLNASGVRMSRYKISEHLWMLDKRGVLARLSLAEDGFSRSDDPTAWDALVRVIAEGR